MKKIGILAIMSVMVYSCNNTKTTDAIPKPGTQIAHDEVPVKEDTLNKFTFSVTIKADSQIEKGIYDVTASWGHNIADSKFTMPKGGESLVPILRRGNKPYSFMVGFKAGKDTAFNEYYAITGENGTIKMQYTKSYSFE